MTVRVGEYTRHSTARGEYKTQHGYGSIQDTVRLGEYTRHSTARGVRVGEYTSDSTGRGVYK